MAIRSQIARKLTDESANQLRLPLNRYVYNFIKLLENTWMSESCLFRSYKHFGISNATDGLPELNGLN